MCMKFHTFLRTALALDKKIRSTTECYDIQQIYSCRQYSVVVVRGLLWSCQINLYEISHTSETSPGWKDLFNIWMQWYSTNIFSSLILLISSEKVWREDARINLYEISHTSKISPGWKDLFNIWMLWYSTNIFSSLILLISSERVWREVARINLHETSHTSETGPGSKDLFNIWVLWYSTNIFSSPILVSSENVSIRSC